MTAGWLDWRARTAWVFDMDGTLTEPVHDFDEARRILEIAPGDDILGAIAQRSPAAQQQAHAWLERWELELAGQARPQSDALELVARLQAAGCQLGVLTRNTRAVAERTLQAIGLDDVFAPVDVLGRTCAAPKPASDGVALLLNRWKAPAHHAVMVGDYIHDSQAGRAAGTATVLVRRRPGVSWEEYADVVVDSLSDLPVHLPAR